MDIHRYPEIRSHVHMGPMKKMVDGEKIKNKPGRMIHTAAIDLSFWDTAVA